MQTKFVKKYRISNDLLLFDYQHHAAAVLLNLYFGTTEPKSELLPSKEGNNFMSAFISPTTQKILIVKNYVLVRLPLKCHPMSHSVFTKCCNTALIPCK